MCKKYFGFILAIIIICCITTSSYSVNAEDDVFKNFTTNLTGLKVVNGTWVAAEKGIIGSNKAEGNTYVMSDVLIKEGVSFTYSADISFSGLAAGIVFGIKDPTNPSVTWYSMNLDNGGTVVLSRVFFVDNSTLVTDNNVPMSDLDVSMVHNFKIDVSAMDDSIEFYLDNEYVGVLSDSGYAGGYLGVYAAAADATINNAKYSVLTTTTAPSLTASTADKSSTTAAKSSTPTVSSATPTSVLTKTSSSTNAIKTTASVINNDGIGSFIIVWSVLIIVLAGAIVAVVFIIVIKKKKKQL